MAMLNNHRVMVDGIIWHLASGYLALGSRRGSQGFVQRRAALVHLPPRKNPLWLENRPRNWRFQWEKHGNGMHILEKCRYKWRFIARKIIYKQASVHCHV
jgi:hypothetical protein